MGGQPTDPRWATRAPSAAAQASLAGAVPHAATAAASTITAPAEAEWLADAVAAQPARPPKAAGAIDQQTLVIAGAGIVGFVLVGILLLLVGAQNRGLAERPEDQTPDAATATSNTGQPPSIPPSYAPPPPGQAPPPKVAISTNPLPPKTVTTPVVKRPPIEPKQEPPSGEGPQVAPPKTDPPPKAVPKFTPGEPINVLDLLTDKNAVGKKGWQSAGRGKPWVTRNGSAFPGPRRPDTEGAGLILPVTLTRNYDLSLEVEHLQDGVGPLMLVVPAGDQWTVVVMDGAPPSGPPGVPNGSRPGFPPPRGRPPFPKAGPRPQGGPGGPGQGGLGPGPDSPGAPMLTNAVLEGKTRVIIKVRGSTVTCDDEEVNPVDATNPLGPVVNLAEPDRLLLASLGGYRVNTMTFTPR